LIHEFVFIQPGFSALGRQNTFVRYSDPFQVQQMGTETKDSANFEKLKPSFEESLLHEISISIKSSRLASIESFLL
jgi:hypothetical protein